MHMYIIYIKKNADFMALKQEVILDTITNPRQPAAVLHYRHCCHHFAWTRAACARSMQTGSEHSMAAGWNSSFCCSQAATHHVASRPALPLSPVCLSHTVSVHFCGSGFFFSIHKHFRLFCEINSQRMMNVLK